MRHKQQGWKRSLQHIDQKRTSVLSKDTTRNAQTLTYVVMLILTQNLLARVYIHSNTCQKCGKNWPHKESPCPAQGCTCMRSVENQPTFPRCVELWSSQMRHGTTKESPGCQLNKRVSQAAVTINIFTQLAATSPKSLQCL